MYHLFFCCAKTERDPDIALVPKMFMPARGSGHKLNSGRNYTPLDLFQLFFLNNMVQSLYSSTNKLRTSPAEKSRLPMDCPDHPGVLQVSAPYLSHGTGDY